jgi:hypothetical protein
MRCPFSLGRIALITALGFSAFAATAQNPQPLNPDQLEAAIADRTPGFAGYTYREDGTAVARMVDSSVDRDVHRERILQNHGPTQWQGPQCLRGESAG